MITEQAGRWYAYLDGERVSLWSRCDVDAGWIDVLARDGASVLRRRGRVELLCPWTGRVTRAERGAPIAMEE